MASVAIDFEEYRPSPDVNVWELPSGKHPISQGVFPLFLDVDEFLFPIGTAFSIGKAIQFLITAEHTVGEAIKLEPGLERLRIEGKLPPQADIRKSRLWVLHQRPTDNGVTFTLWPIERVNAAPPTDVVFAFPKFAEGLRTIAHRLSFDLPKHGDKVRSLGCVVDTYPENGLPLLDIQAGRFDWANYKHRLSHRSSEIDRTYLYHLRNICDDPRLNENDESLRPHVDKFADWLEKKAFVEKVWLPSVGVEANLLVARIVFIKICGNIAKHNYSRLDKDVRKLEKLLREHGAIVERDQAFLALEDFYQWFHTNLFSYHTTTIAEHLNNIRWAIYEYLQPEFQRSFTRDSDGIGYRFRLPVECQEPLAHAIYWDLMNAVRSKPYFPKFTTTRYLQMRY